ncbi:MAG TPA: TetR/AcrR family transcriptional regulator [Xanthobacteraceae bacterium]|nr:TetR/AcrR family transcriptional regulator [Xanthobacteraceae bacterium]
MEAQTAPVPPRERILKAAGELFYRQGIRAVGVDAIAEAAGTNKMTLYRHFPSKDELVAEYLRQFARRAEAFWDRLETEHPGDPLAQLHAWVKHMAGDVICRGGRGCALANAAVELAEKEHPARRVIEAFKKAQRERLTRLCRAAGLSDPELLADELHLVLEGARVSLQSVGPEDLGARIVRIGEAIIASHSQFR